MKRSAFAASTMLVLFSLPALAYHCPADMKKIDAALAENPQLSEEQASQVTQLRAEGEADHNAGNHDAAVEKLGQAMSILGIQ